MKKLINSNTEYDKNYGINDFNLKTEIFKKKNKEIMKKTISEIYCVLFLLFLAYIITIVLGR